MRRIQTAKIQPHETEHSEYIRKNAAECALFLKRNGDFPIAPCSVNLYGNGARRTVKGGKGSGDVNVRQSVSVEQGLKDAGFTVTTEKLLDEFDKVCEQTDVDFWNSLVKEAEENNTSPYYIVMFRPRFIPEFRFLSEGSKDGEVNIYVLSRDSSEGIDRICRKGDYLLTDEETEEITALAKENKKFLLVLNVGGVVDISPLDGIVENILLLGQLGAETGNVFADILTGKSYPSGKLSATWAKTLNDYPSTAYFGQNTEIDYKEGEYVGYRYFETTGREVAYPFGFGLSYTEFSVTPTGISINGGSVCLDVCVKNIGLFAGKEVIQIYYRNLGGKLNCRQLLAYKKTSELLSGEGTIISVSFDAADMAEYDEKASAYAVKKGKYAIYAGNSVKNNVCVCVLNVATEVIVERAYKVKTCDFEELSFDKADEECIRPLFGEDEISDIELREKEKTERRSFVVSSMTNEELINVCVGVLNDMTLSHNIGDSGKIVAGAAGETWSGKLSGGKEIAPLSLADGPAGLRLSTTYRLNENDKVITEHNALAGILPGAIGKTKDKKDDSLFYQYCTAIPVGTALAQSWNESFCEKLGEIVGSEMQLFGVDIWLAPALNIQRNPLCGRNFEYYSEDPVLSGTIAAAVVNGVQSIEGRSVTIKHFAANNQETDRLFSSSNISEKTLRDIYLKGFKICIEKSQPNALMTSYNLINGVHAAESEELVGKILRDEWNYDGVVMTDWLSTGGMGTGEKYGPSSASGCIRAGGDLIMPGRVEDCDDIRRALSGGRITRKNLEESAGRILYLEEMKKKGE